MPKLYEMTADYKAMLNEDLEPEQLKDCLESIQGAIEEKGGAIVSLIANMQPDIDGIDREIKRLQQMKKTAVNKQESLKEYLRYNMIESGITKISHPLFNISIRKGVKKVKVTNELLLPDELINVKVETKPDLKAIKKALENGEVSGAELIDGNPSLTIK